jgi:hypothetical protein
MWGKAKDVKAESHEEEERRTPSSVSQSKHASGDPSAERAAGLPGAETLKLWPSQGSCPPSAQRRVKGTRTSTRALRIKLLFTAAGSRLPRVSPSWWSLHSLPSCPRGQGSDWMGSLNLKSPRIRAENLPHFPWSHTWLNPISKRRSQLSGSHRQSGPAFSQAAWKQLHPKALTWGKKKKPCKARQVQSPQNALVEGRIQCTRAHEPFPGDRPGRVVQSVLTGSSDISSHGGETTGGGDTIHALPTLHSRAPTVDFQSLQAGLGFPGH